MPSPPRGASAQRNPNSTPPFIVDPTAPSRETDRRKDGIGATPAREAQIEPAKDIRSTHTGYMTNYAGMQVVEGVIKDGTPLANQYWVDAGFGLGIVLGTLVSGSPIAAWGPTEINGLSPGTKVLVARHGMGGGDNRCYIFGAIPAGAESPKRVMHDYISQASRNRVDDGHKKHIKQEKSSGLGDYSNWRPYDATLGGEWGVITSTGVSLTVDDFMLQAAVNEFCGMYGFYHDNLLRVAGYNLQVWTAGSERESFMDQAECNDSQGYTPYPWEGMGVLQAGLPVIEEYRPGCFHAWDQKPYYAHWENKNEFAQPYHRSQVFFGYLGQGMRQLVHAPPVGLQRWTYKGEPGSEPPPPYDSKIEGNKFKPVSEGGPTKDTDHEEQPVFGLSEENKALDGRIFMASAKGVHILKRMLLPFPQRIKRPEDVENGDDAKKNYKAAGKYGAGDPHLITGTIKTTDDKYPNLQRAAGILDLHGYLYNYSGLHGFYWHAKDYKTWEQQDLKYAKVNQVIPDFQLLTSQQMYLKPPTPNKQIKIDHRYDENPQEFFENESYISLLEDGGVMIGDGYGSEIRMTGGCIFLTAPGDVWCKAGRDVQMWGGSDVITRAQNTVDISCTEKNVRIKAEEHVLIMGGNKKTVGGVLIESKATQECCDFECGDDIRFCGIALKAPCTRLDIRAKDLYLGTNVRKYGCTPGMIVIDADDGRSSILTKSSNIFHYVTDNIFHFFGDGPCENWTTRKSNFFSDSFTLLCGPVGTDSSIILDGHILSRGSGLFSRGHVFTSEAENVPFVLPCVGLCGGIVNAIVEIIEQLIETVFPFIGNLIHYFYFTLVWCDIKCDPEFSFRLDEHYAVNEFLLYEDRWQQMSRLGGKEVKRWTEKPVQTKCGPTYPFPGKKWLTEEPVYQEQDLQIAQIENDGFIDKRRGEAPNLADEYKKPEFKPPAAPKIINGNYLIVPRQTS